MPLELKGCGWGYEGLYWLLRLGRLVADDLTISDEEAAAKIARLMIPLEDEDLPRSS
jgi:hypothetical protein